MADRVILAGLPFAAASADQLAGWIASRRRTTGCATVISATADFVIRASRDEDLAEELRQVALLTPASKSIVWLSRLVGRSLPNCVTGNELILSLAAHAARSGARLLLAGNAHVQRAAEALTIRFPTLSIEAVEFSDTGRTSDWIEHLKKSDADLFVLAMNDACNAVRAVCADVDNFPAGAGLLLTDPRDLQEIALAKSGQIVALTTGARSRGLREALSFLPVLFHEWLHLMGARRAYLPPHPFSAATDDADLPPDRLPDPAVRQRLKRAILVAFDMTNFATCFLLADWFRCRLWMHTSWPQPELNPTQQWYWYLWILPVLMAVWPPILASVGLYRSALPPSTWRWQRAVVVGLILCMVFSTFALFFSRLAYPRMQILVTSLLVPFGFMIGRSLLVAAARLRRWFNDLGLPDYSSY